MQLLRVAFLNRPPYSFATDKGYTGSSVEVLQEIARREGWELQFYEVKTEDAAIASLISDAADVAVGGLTITLERSLIVDYGHVFDIVPLRTLVRKDQGRWQFLSIFGGLLNWGVLALVIVGTVGVVICGFLIRSFEKGKNDKMFPPERKQTIWWSAQTMVAHNCGSFVPVTQRGRLIALLLMVGGTIFTAQLTALLVTSLSHSVGESAPIHGPSDFGNRQIGTVADTEAERWLVDNLVATHAFPSLDEAAEALRTGEVAAVAYDYGALENYLKSNKVSDLVVTGPDFGTHPHAMLLQKNSDYRPEIDAVTQELTLDGTLNRIIQKWYGEGIELSVAQPGGSSSSEPSPAPPGKPERLPSQD